MLQMRHKDWTRTLLERLLSSAFLILGLRSCRAHPGHLHQYLTSIDINLYAAPVTSGGPIVLLPPEFKLLLMSLSSGITPRLWPGR